MLHLRQVDAVLPRFVFALALAAWVPSIGAQEFPARTVRWIVPYPPGGTSDFLARLIGQKLTERWKQVVVVDNRGGAGGNIGTEAAANAAADGYTMLLVASTMTINQSLYPKLAFDAVRSFAPVTNLLWQPYALAVHPSLPVRSVRDLVALARARPGALDYSSGGNGNGGHIAAALFAASAGVKLTHIPYRGMGPAILALVQGNVQLTFASVLVVAPHLGSGRLRVLGITGRDRVAAMPDVPTISEAGVPGYVEGNWQGVLVPAGTPREIISTLNREIVRVVRSPEIAQQIVRLGADVIASSPDEFASVIRADLERYAEVVRNAGIRPD